MTIYYEDLDIGRRTRTAGFSVDRGEMVAFARHWDPRPFHVDEAAAERTMYGQLIASGAFTMSVYLKLNTAATLDWATTGALGWDEVRFRLPVRAGDVLSVETEVIEKRLSKSRPDTGIVRSRQKVVNQRGEDVLTFIAAFLMATKHDNDLPTDN